MNPASWLTLANAFVSAAEYAALCEHFDNADDIVRQSAAALQQAGLASDKANRVSRPDRRELDNALHWLDQDSHHIVCCDAGSGSAACPELLRGIPGPPLLLYVAGSVDVLHLPALAIVGSRNPTRGGIRNAVEFARYLGSSGFAITSGLAEGIDTAAHRGALQADAPTVAVLGHGIDRIYPSQNHALAHDIHARGALVSEYPLGTPPARHHFPERNRLISGLSLGVLVVEAARRSGTLITARLAAEQGREVFAIPGSIHNPLARGCHALIRQGAKLVETAADIGAELGVLVQHLKPAVGSKPAADSDPSEADSPVDADYGKLRDALSHDPVAIDELMTQSGLTIEQLSSMLLILELQGEVEAMSGGRYALAG